ncbi:Sak4-like ssDNA annealing protein [Cellulophaga phage phi14:2]|uniref:ATPase containing protein n=1 Tax=Cellulophaga phage phi14:2 TaxID=1327990 RepID=S0A3W7_9CAUD|nr:Sak4-like ssDNA annealing protein [Cellulophaga phage phi14:2]AGO48923.1 ATPase containing protein [Cellulophaga phage phi14:2]
MATLVYVVGKSGRGKSTSCMNLDPDSTAIVNSDQKDLPFPQFKSKYNKEKNNYLQSSNIVEITNFLKGIQGNKQIKTLVIDTWSRIMTDSVMSNSFRNASNGMQAWSNMSFENYNLLNIINEKLREDIIVYIMCHPETVYDESGFARERIAVQGQQLKKMEPESFSSIVLYAEAIKNPGEPVSYFFRTATTGNDSCKTPIGMFDEELVPNDLVAINDTIIKYYS